MALTAAEQYELELINRARLDPEAEAALYGISLNEGLAAGTISADAKQVLAPNKDLEDAAQKHSEWMIASDVFSHTGSGGSSAGNRMIAEGYNTAGGWGWAENLAAVLTTGALDLEAAIEQHHQELFLSEGHRTNTLNASMREIGIAQVQGQFTYLGVTYTASMLTENFAYAGSKVFVTGVAYDDADNDAFYGIGEGLGGIRFVVSGVSATSETAGGYSVGVSPAAAVSVSVQQGSSTLASLTMDVSTGNGKLDLVMGANDVWRLELSSSATLVSGVAEATLLGVADLNLTGHSGGNVLTGNKGDNVISGAGGNDTLTGGDGSDRLNGGTGSDVLDGGLGNDIYIIDATGDVILNEILWVQGGGVETVESWVSTSLAQNVEILRLQGSENLSGTGKSAAPDALMGNSGNNQLDGLGGSDRLNGHAGNDTLIGGYGQDWLVGGAGADVFVYRSVAESGVGSAVHDLINGFERGADKISLSQIDANAFAAGDQAFRYIGAAGFSGQGAASAGELRVYSWGGADAVMVEVDTNGNGGADLQIYVMGTSTLSASDFIL